MKDEEILDFGKSCIELLRKHIEKFLGPLPNYKMEIWECQKYDRADVPFNVEKSGLLIFFKQGIEQNFLRDIREGNNEDRIGTMGYWIESLIHDLIHLYQEVSLEKIDQDEKRDNYSNKYWPWEDGFAEYMAWKISFELYEKAKPEKNYWSKRKNINDVLEAIELGKYKSGIRRRFIDTTINDYPILYSKGLEGLFIVPEFVPEDIRQEIYAKIKNKKYETMMDPYLFLHYVLGFALVTRIIEYGKIDYMELLNNPKNIRELVALTQRYIKK